MSRLSDSTSFIRCMLVISGAIACGWVTAPVHAQEQSTVEEQENVVVVTGSRIRRIEQEGPSPVVTITAQDMSDRGYQTVLEALNDLPQNSGGGFDQQNTFGLTPSASAIDLRGFGVGRSLVLIDGRRVPVFPLAANGTDNFVDLSSIPAVAVDRIEVLTDGASAIYGSDAVSGVVNIILKKHADNQLSLRRSDTTGGGGAQDRLQSAVAAGLARRRAESAAHSPDRGTLPMKGFIIALQFLTRLPTPAVVVDDAAFARSMRWFPAAGLMIGALVAGAAWAGALVDPWIGALIALIVWVGVTGALHLDGLSDLADAGGAVHKDRERLLAVLADPHVGSFGVVAIVLQLLSKLALLHMLVDARAFGPLVLVPFAARVGPLVWTWWLLPLHEGVAARFRSAIGPLDLIGWTTALAAASWFTPALLVTPLLILWWGWHVRRTIGGISGDGHGAGIELIETALLLSLSVTARWVQAT